MKLEINTDQTFVLDIVVGKLHQWKREIWKQYIGEGWSRNRKSIKKKYSIIECCIYSISHIPFYNNASFII